MPEEQLKLTISLAHFRNTAFPGYIFIEVPSHIWNFVRHNQFRISHSFNIYWAPTKPIYTLSHMPDPLPSGSVFQWPKTQMVRKGEHMLLRIISLPLRSSTCQESFSSTCFPPKGINFIICLFDSKSRCVCTQSKQNYGHLRTLTESKELCCPTQTKCLAERIRFIVENRQAICSLNQWSPHYEKSLFWIG